LRDGQRGGMKAPMVLQTPPAGISLTLNGQPLAFAFDGQTPLLWALREGANLTGTKFGCGTGDCGACTVMVDGQATRACQISLAAAEGREVVTIEGLSPNRAHVVQQAMVAEQAIQCGFCTPGVVMAAAALLATNPAPDEEAIKAAITNLCPCGAQPRILRAVLRASKALLGQGILPPVPAFR
jgi:isoquinoline 1-oxidoreductase alpha subunit